MPFHAFRLSLNTRWLNVLPDAGDPTDTSIKLRPLEPASGQALARDLVLKTRRRKGLGDQISVSKYLDDEFIVRVTCSIVSATGADRVGSVAACAVGVGACRLAGVVYDFCVYVGRGMEVLLSPCASVMGRRAAVAVTVGAWDGRTRWNGGGAGESVAYVAVFGRGIAEWWILGGACCMPVPANSLSYSHSHSLPFSPPPLAFHPSRSFVHNAKCSALCPARRRGLLRVGSR